MWRRLIGKLAMTASLLLSLGTDTFLPQQVGFESGPCDAVVHSVNALVNDPDADADSVVLFVDLTNAFNMVSRTKFMEETSRNLCTKGLFQLAHSV